MNGRWKEERRQHLESPRRAEPPEDSLRSSSELSFAPLTGIARTPLRSSASPAVPSAELRTTRELRSRGRLRGRGSRSGRPAQPAFSNLAAPPPGAPRPFSPPSEQALTSPASLRSAGPQASTAPQPCPAPSTRAKRVWARKTRCAESFGGSRDETRFRPTTGQWQGGQEACRSPDGERPGRFGGINRERVAKPARARLSLEE